MKLKKGRFYALEGGEATGKTSMAKMLKEKLEKDGYKVIITREPGGVPSAEAIRANIMDFKLDGKTEALLYTAARREHYLEVIKPAIENGYIVISDRFALSMYAYQSFGRGVNLLELERLTDFACEGFMPDVNIIIDVPVEVSLKRKSEVLEQNRFDLEQAEFHEKVRVGYKFLSKMDKHKAVMVNGEQEMEKVTEEIYEKIKENLKLRKKKKDDKDVTVCGLPLVSN